MDTYYAGYSHPNLIPRRRNLTFTDTQFPVLPFPTEKMVKLNADKTSSRRKMRKAHFGATSFERRDRMAAPLKKDLFLKYKVRSMPIIKGDEVKVVRGDKDILGKEGKVTGVYRKKYVIHVERCTLDKSNGQQIPIGINASNVVITSLKLDKTRKAILQRKKNTKKGGKTSANTMSLVD